MRPAGAKECPAAEPSACPAQFWAPIGEVRAVFADKEATKDAAGRRPVTL